MAFAGMINVYAVLVLRGKTAIKSQYAKIIAQTKENASKGYVFVIRDIRERIALKWALRNPTQHWFKSFWLKVFLINKI